jgi:hypothetical protein
MASTKRFLRLAIASVLIGGCAVEVEGASGGDDERVLDHVEALGFERSEAHVLDDRVIVQGDILFDRQGLLDGEYERWERPDSSALIQKGYRYPGGQVSAKNRGNIRLLFAKGKFAPTPEIRSAFVAAARAWSQIPGSSIRISSDNTGPAIVVRTVPVNNWDKYSPCPDTDACTFAPRDGRPGYDLFIRAESLDRGCATWSPSGLAYAAKHELGHAIGFAHPKESGSKHVDRTGECDEATADACVANAGYATVMGAAAIKPGCVYTPARVTQDDYATCVAVYPAK